jgi:hypothetical protein
MKRFAIIVSVLFLLAASASAEIRSIDITVFGMD